jgi:uncharacterized protein involved in exopolysaccharide biosynthesis
MASNSSPDNLPNDEWDDKDEISLLDLALTISENLKLLIFAPLIAGFIALIIAIIWPNIYTGKATILPPTASSNISANSLLMNNYASLGIMDEGLSGLKDPALIYIGYLDSEAFRNILIKRFDLLTYYNKDTFYDARIKLDRNLTISSNKQSGIISIEFDAYEKDFAAQVANGIVEELRLFVGSLNLQETKNRQEYLQAQIKMVSNKSFQDSISQEMIIRGLIRQYEMAQLDLSLNGPTFTQVDFAYPPERKSKPRVILISLIAIAATGFITLLMVFTRRALDISKNDSNQYKKIILIKQFWLSFLGKK